MKFKLNPNAPEFIPMVKIRAKLLSDPTYLRPMMPQRSSKHVACLLDEGDEQVRRVMLVGVTAQSMQLHGDSGGERGVRRAAGLP